MLNHQGTIPPGFFLFEKKGILLILDKSSKDLMEQRHDGITTPLGTSIPTRLAFMAPTIICHRQKKKKQQSYVTQDSKETRKTGWQESNQLIKETNYIKKTTQKKKKETKTSLQDLHRRNRPKQLQFARVLLSQGLSFRNQFLDKARVFVPALIEFAARKRWKPWNQSLKDYQMSGALPWHVP